MLTNVTVQNQNIFINMILCSSLGIILFEFTKQKYLEHENYLRKILNSCLFFYKTNVQGLLKIPHKYVLDLRICESALKSIKKLKKINMTRLVSLLNSCLGNQSLCYYLVGAASLSFIGDTAPGHFVISCEV